MSFERGKSGNPSGRPAGSGWVGAARKALQEAWDGEEGARDGIKEKLLQKAREGDMAAIRLIAERVCPPIKAMEPTTPIELSGETLTDKGAAILAGLASGELTPGQAAQLMTALASFAKVYEADELARRIEALESARKG